MSIRSSVLTAGVLAYLMSATLAAAQGAQMPFGGYTLDSSLPIEVAADSLRVDQEAGTAVFEGAVVADQGDFHLRADRVEVYYGKPENGGAISITRMVAVGSVRVTNGAESAEAKSADYDVLAGIIRMREDVLLTQGNNLISGDRATVDLNKGTARVEGRVRTVIRPKEGTE